MTYLKSTATHLPWNMQIQARQGKVSKQVTFLHSRVIEDILTSLVMVFFRLLLINNNSVCQVFCKIIILTLQVATKLWQRSHHHFLLHSFTSRRVKDLDKQLISKDSEPDIPAQQNYLEYSCFLSQGVLCRSLLINYNFAYQVLCKMMILTLEVAAKLFGGREATASFFAAFLHKSSSYYQLASQSLL